MPAPDVVIVDLSKGKFVFKGRSKTTRFAPDDIKGMAAYLAPRLGRTTFVCASSIRHPEENGLSENFDANDILNKVTVEAHKKLAVRIPPGDFETGPERIEKVVDGKTPITLLFERTGKQGEDVLIQLSDESATTHFLNGMRYARALARIERKPMKRPRK